MLGKIFLVSKINFLIIVIRKLILSDNNKKVASIDIESCFHDYSRL